jgi:hypothetical protein
MKVPIAEDAQKGLLDALVTLRQTFLDAGVTVTRGEVANWYAAIGQINSWAKWQAYERKRVLLEIECMIAIGRRL